jgi:flavin-dependent dehydrogenase
VRTADVLIVGAGPAGSIAALVLARAGARVRILDRAGFPRHKLCGDTLNPGALARLEALGVAARVRARALPVAGMIVTGPGGVRVVGAYDGNVRGAALTRSVLDGLLLEAAIEAGAEFVPEATVRAPLLDAAGRVAGVRGVAARREHDATARVVIAADGRRSRLASALRLVHEPRRERRWAFGAYFSGAAGLTGCGEMHIRENGYVGVAPLPGGLANVCVVRRLGAWGGGDAAGVIDRALAHDPELGARFARACRVGPVSVLGPLAVDARAAGMPGLLLAGDAGGFVDPMTGDGLRFAIRGAELAAHCALEELATGAPMHRALARRRRAEFGRKWLVNRTLRALVASPSALRLAAGVTRWADAPVQRLIAIAGDVERER